MEKNADQNQFEIKDAANFETLETAITSLHHYETTQLNKSKTIKKSKNNTQTSVKTVAGDLGALHYNIFAKHNAITVADNGHYVDLGKIPVTAIAGVTLNEFNKNGRARTSGDRKVNEFFQYLISSVIKETMANSYSSRV